MPIVIDPDAPEDDIIRGVVKSWTAPGMMRLSARDRSNTYETRLFTTYTWAGSYTRLFSCPVLSVTSIAYN